MNAMTPFDDNAANAAGASLETRDFQDIAAILMSEARIALLPQKATLVRSRLARRLRDRGVMSYRAYIDLVRRDAAERRIMVEALTTNHTHFFREGHHFDHLRDHVMPQLRIAPPRRPIRIWSSASSSGEEVYSIAMCLLGRDSREAQWLSRADVRLLATDISSEMVEATRTAVYSEQAAQAVPEPYRKLWTRTSGGKVSMGEEARSLVSALELNLFDRWPMQRPFDVIFCRNVMIYFDEEAKAELESRMIAQLVPGGHLYIGHSERLVGPERDFMIPCGQTIYRKPLDGEVRG